MAVNDIVMGAAGAGAPPTYVEDVFSTYLYTGNSSTQTITNGIDLSGKGGLTWIKARSTTYPHVLVDTARGATKTLMSNGNYAEQTATSSLTAFNSTGFSLGNDSDVNFNNATYASWTFRKQPKFFDIVTYTGDGVAGKSIAHSLGSKPGCILVKRTSATSSWAVWHRAYNSGDGYGFLESTSAFSTDGGGIWGDGSTHIEPTSTDFTINSNYNGTGSTYVAYLFAHNAGGFGATGTDNVISCGSYTGNGLSAGPVINLGYEAQWLMIKRANGTANWSLFDIMRGMPTRTGGGGVVLRPNTTEADQAIYGMFPNPTGFTVGDNNLQVNADGETYIYIAIRRPMKTPTTGTEVFAPRPPSTTTKPEYQTSFPVDLIFYMQRTGGTHYITDRLIGTNLLSTISGNAEAFASNYSLDFQNGAFNSIAGDVSWYVGQCFRRAPAFLDIVCYTGNGGTNRQISHNLGVKPELVIYKPRNNSGNWVVFTNYDYEMYLNMTTALQGPGYSGNHGDPTSSYLVAQGGSNTNGYTFVAYLFATLAGISKVGSYAGNGSSQTINCSFTTGARFIMIKRTDSSGDWFVWDTARGIVSGNDPHISLNTNLAEVTSDDSVDADSSGFIVNQLSATNINVNAATYIFLAIA